MSLSLIQGYSSAEEEEENPLDHRDHSFSASSGEEDDGGEYGGPSARSYKAVLDRSSINASSSSSGLPSALDAFSEVSGRPKFLDNAVEEQGRNAKEVDYRQQGRHAGRWGHNRKEKKELPTGAVMEAKPQLVGIHERVRSDIEGSKPPASSVPTTAQEGGKRVPTVANPNAEDAAELLRMCLQCGIPKTYSSARGMVCPVCGDRPLNDANKDPKKKGSTVKDKEKSKRMKGQSSHATWKSETEMQLRQQFD